MDGHNQYLILFVVQVGSRNMPAHSAILACASTYMFELFENEESSGNNHYYQLHDDLIPDCVDMLIDFAYTGR